MTILVFLETDGGDLISIREKLAMDRLDKIGDTLREKGISMEELINLGSVRKGKRFATNYTLEI